MWPTRCKSSSNSWPRTYIICSQRCRQYICNILKHQSIPIKTMEAVNTTADTLIITAKEDVVRNTEEIGKVSKVVRETVI